MTDRERLEEAKLMAEMLRVETRLPYDFPFDLVDWLIEQAGRVQELEDKCNYLSDMNEMLVDLNGVLPDEPELYIKLKEQNKRYREAIRECIEHMKEGGPGTRSFVYETLKKALEGEK